MFIDVNSLVINNISMGQYITEAKFGYNKIWGKDSGRALSGKMNGTLIGIFPKITCQFRSLNQAEINIIAPLLDSSNQSTLYYDPNKNAKITMNTYTGDWEVSNRNLLKNEGFSCAFISTDRRK